MCGIYGILDFRRPIDSGLLHRMADVLRHRGPDGSGVFTADGVALGHRRLSIIDLEGGAQPMSTTDEQLTVIFNGEIYNFVELRDELSSLGHGFVTRSDTEVILHAYRQWGLDCVSRFNGMFAFALWDASSRQLVLARDHLGIKPLYYAQTGSTLLFASEIKALLQSPECPQQVDVRALCDLFTYRYVPSPATLFAGVCKLPPGHVLTVRDGQTRCHRYWTSRPSSSSHWTEHDARDHYQALLKDAVRLQLRSDVPLGLFLSSGVDSALLLALMAEGGVSPVHAFTIDFEGGGRGNESEDASEIAARFGAHHECATITAQDYAQYYQHYLWQLEEPVGNETAAAFFFVSRLTSRRVKVALTGQGADEPWAGYHRYVGAKLSERYSRLPAAVTEMIHRVVRTVPGRFERLRRGAAALRERDALTRLANVYSFYADELKQRVFAGALREELTRAANDAGRALRHLHDDVNGLGALEQMLYIDVRASLPDDLLMVGDKMAMANSLEARVPFLDYRLIEFIESLPASLKLRGLTGKYLHKRAAEKWLPKEIVWRRKKGFSNPVEHWFRHDLRAFVDDLLLSPDAGVAEYFDQRVIKQMLDDDRSGRAQLRRHLYLLVSFELWHRTFMRGTLQSR